MTRSLYVVGPPGVGKTSALNGALRLAQLERAVASVIDPRWPLLRGQQLRRSTIPHGYVLGVHRPAFSGTDALSMAVHPQAVAWATEGRLPRVVVGEGQRLATKGFLGALAARSDLTVVHLTATDEALTARRAARGSDQDASWMAAARTRSTNLIEAVTGMGLDVVELDTTDCTIGDTAVRLAELLRPK